jgi:polysaccharide export outer membrane protein
MAGDLTIYGKRENVLLIREENGQRKFIRLNLNSSNIFESSYYYLKQNDIIYVEPNKQKIASTDAIKLRNISLITAAFTLLIVLLTRTK